MTDTETTPTIGERVADKVADIGGSWRFIFVFFGVMTVWITVNSLQGLWQPFDPFPYILLNLALSLLAAIQAPIIMMSQNRHSKVIRDQDLKRDKYTLHVLEAIKDMLEDHRDILTHIRESRE